MNSPVEYFIKRAEKYDSSSNWVDDQILIDKIRDLANAAVTDRVVDIAIGTGKIAQAFRGHVKYVAGVDICDEMVRYAKQYVDQIVLAPAEKLPFKDNVFDVCVCRQGLQFMKLDDVLAEIARVLKPGGRVVLCHLTAYGELDKDESYLIQRLRNPARINFFLPGDLPDLLKNHGFKDVKSFEYISRESVNQWVDNAAISKSAKEQIKQVYRDASADFKRIHKVKFEKDDILDAMKMVIITAREVSDNE